MTATTTALARPRLDEERTDWVGYVFVAFFTIPFLLFNIGPVFFGAFVAFTKWGIFGKPKWIGLENFTRAFNDEFVGIAFKNNTGDCRLTPTKYVVAMLEETGCELSIHDPWVVAEEALAIGLVNRIVQPPGLAAAKVYAREFTQHGLRALQFAREAVQRALDVPLQEGLRIEADLSTLAYRTRDAEEGMQAFVEKRKPRFGDG